jgi:DNA invertase Pin-like site-specific DNA recombinase
MGARVAIVEDASRLARELVVQELGLISLIDRKVRVFTASGEDLTETDDPFKVAMRQIAGAFAQLKKARLVAKLRHARDRRRAKGGAMSLREVSAALAVEGFMNERRAPVHPNSVASLLA